MSFTHSTDISQTSKYSSPLLLHSYPDKIRCANNEKEIMAEVIPHTHFSLNGVVEKHIISKHTLFIEWFS